MDFLGRLGAAGLHVLVPTADGFDGFFKVFPFRGEIIRQDLI
jgi:hypothetical protein